MYLIEYKEGIRAGMVVNTTKKVTCRVPILTLFHLTAD